VPSTAASIAFCSTQDADSEGEEGKFFAWTPDEIRDILGDDGDGFISVCCFEASGDCPCRRSGLS
jgi:uncharacterized protein YyaL (SSP411 family)